MKSHKDPLLSISPPKTPNINGNGINEKSNPQYAELERRLRQVEFENHQLRNKRKSQIDIMTSIHLRNMVAFYLFLLHQLQSL